MIGHNVAEIRRHCPSNSNNRGRAMSDATLHTNIVQTDQAQYKSSQKGDSPVLLLAHAARKSGRSVFSIAREARRYKRSKMKVTLDEYVKLRLYDHEAHTEEERGQVITWLLQNACLHAVNDVSWFGVTEDKWNSSKFLEADGVPVPETLGMINTSGRRYHGGKGIDGPEALRAVLADTAFPLFGKHNKGLGSVGVFIIDGANDEYVHLRGVGEMRYEAFFRNIIGQDAFILQRFVDNHAMLREITGTAATIRMVNMWTKDGLYTPYAVLKLPSATNSADNFWRPGNLICNIDPATGRIETIVSADGPDMVFHDAHPETGAALIGQTLPHWDALLDVNAHVAELHTPLKYQSADIALTDAGPVVIEVNAGSSFILPQYARGKGFMIPRVKNFFIENGVDFL